MPFSLVQKLMAGARLIFLDMLFVGAKKKETKKKIIKASLHLDLKVMPIES